VDRALAGLEPGQRLQVRGSDPNLAVHLVAWCRGRGHACSELVVTKGPEGSRRWHGAHRAGDPRAVAEQAPASWGLAARGALVEAGGPDLLGADLCDKPSIWAEIAPKLYAQAAASQWDPRSAIDWNAPGAPDPDVEGAVVQVMTFLVENEQAALLVPARFVGRIHPHYREVLALLAIQMADEARHIEVFTRRATLRRSSLGTSSAGGRASLQTLLDEPTFGVAEFLLAVLGEGTFLHLLSFLESAAPDPVTARVAHLALQDEARHVAFGMAHLDERLATDPGLRQALREAIVRRHDALAQTAGLNDDVFDALVVLAAGAWSPDAIGRGFGQVVDLQAEMDEGRQRRLARLGFSASEAAELSALHTRNFM
jgi:hypothetical protein